MQMCQKEPRDVGHKVLLPINTHPTFMHAGGPSLGYILQVIICGMDQPWRTFLPRIVWKISLDFFFFFYEQQFILLFVQTYISSYMLKDGLIIGILIYRYVEFFSD